MASSRLQLGPCPLFLCFQIHHLERGRPDRLVLAADPEAAALGGPRALIRGRQSRMPVFVCHRELVRKRQGLSRSAQFQVELQLVRMLLGNQLQAVERRRVTRVAKPSVPCPPPIFPHTARGGRPTQLAISPLSNYPRRHPGHARFSRRRNTSSCARLRRRCPSECDSSLSASSSSVPFHCAAQKLLQFAPDGQISRANCTCTPPLARASPLA